MGMTLIGAYVDEALESDYCRIEMDETWDDRLQELG